MLRRFRCAFHELRISAIKECFSRKSFCHFDGLEYTFALPEYLIHFFEVKAISFWEEEIYSCESCQSLYCGPGPCSLTWQDKKEISTGEHKKVLPSDGGEGGWRDFRDHEAVLSQSVRLQDLVKHASVDSLEDPCTPCAHGCYRNSDHERADLAGVEERQAKETDGKEETEQEQERASCGDTGDIRCLRSSSGNNGHASSHAERRNQHELSSSKTIDCEDPNRRAQRLEGKQ
jgi:hypothetical protein